MKFLVMWRLNLSMLSGEVVRAVLRMPEYAQPLQEQIGRAPGRERGWSAEVAE